MGTAHHYMIGSSEKIYGVSLVKNWSHSMKKYYAGALVICSSSSWMDNPLIENPLRIIGWYDYSQLYFMCQHFV